MDSGAEPASGPTVVGPTRAERILVWVGFPLLGACAGWLLKSLAGWAASLPWVPFQGPLKLVDSFPDPQATIGSLAVGAVAGLVIALLAEEDYLVVTVDDEKVEIARGRRAVATVRRSVINAVFHDQKRLVLLDNATEELASEGGDVDAKRLEAAFVARGYPWRPGGDPHRDEYRRWVEGTPDLPVGTNAVLKARARALEKGDKDGVADLRRELARLGIVVRDEKKRQFWRPTRPVSLAI